MRKSILLGAMLLIASCTVQKEEEFENQAQHRYHAVAEEPVDAETRVYADSKLRVRWNEGDHISIFERNTYNQEFEFLGDTGDTAGDFDLVESSGYHSGGDIEDGHVYAVYPYEKKNKCDFDGTLTVAFPSVQHYKKDSFGVGANVMVARTNTLDLRFMHVGGYRTFKLYGEDVSVSSVRIESNGPEYLSGRTEVVIGEDGKPEVSFIESTSNLKSVELVCDTPVALGTTASEAVEFWFVLPPGTLTQGFTVTVTDVNGNEFSKSTSNSIEVKSGVKKSMPAFEVEIEYSQPNNVIYYTSTDGNIVTPTRANEFGANIISNEYENGLGVITFDGDVTSIGEYAFYSFTAEGATGNLETISLPNSINSIGRFAFTGQSIKTISIPEGVKEIPDCCFHRCTELREVILPEGIERIGESAFEKATALVSVSFPSTLISIDGYAFYDCSRLSISVPDQLESLGDQAFCRCIISDVIIPSGLISIGVNPFRDCSINSISVNTENPAYDSRGNCNAIIEKATAKVITACKATNLPVGILNIGSRSFNVKGITSVTLPSSVKRMENLPFYTDLQDLYCHPFNKPLGFDIGENNIGAYGYCTLHVPKGCLNEYSFWGNKIQEIDDRIVVDGSNINRNKEYWEKIVAVKFTGTVTWDRISWIFYIDYGDEDEDVYHPNVLECDFRDASFPAQTYSAIDNSGDIMFSGSAGENEYASGMFSYTSVQSIVLPSNIVKVENINGYYGCFRFIEIPSSQAETISMDSFGFEPNANLVLVCDATTPPSISVSNSGATSWALFVPSSAQEAYLSSDWNRYFTFISSL